MFLKAAEAVRQLLVDENPFQILRVYFFSTYQYWVVYNLLFPGRSISLRH